MSEEIEYKDPKQVGGIKYKCANCDAEFETEHQRRGHNMKCRPKRVPFGSPAKRMNCPDDDDKYHYRVFNDNWRKEPGRIQRALKAGYEVVDDEVTGMAVGTNDDGSEIKAVLMRIPKEWYDEDQAKKAEKLDEIDKQIYGEAMKKSRYGSVKIENK